MQAPIPGRVKPRLAEDLGPSAAAEVYWQVVRRVLTGLAGAGYRTTVWFAPATEEPFVREWLEGVGRVELRPQAGGGPTDPISHTATRLFAEGARRLVVTGAECPGLDRRLVTEAFAALGACDVVVGPTQSGFYLLGLRAPPGALLRGMSAAGAAALPQLRARAGDAGLTLRVLRPLRAVETLQDARVLGLLPGGSTIDGT